MLNKRWVLPLILVGAFLIRVIPAWGQVFTPDGVIFSDPDASTHMHLADLQVANGWAPIFFNEPRYRPLLTWLIAYPSMMFGGSRGIMDVWGAFLPVIIGVAVVYVTYRLARRLKFDSWAYMAAAIVAILPAEFMHRSSLGVADHHVLEALWLTLIVYFLVGRTWWAAALTFGAYAFTWAGIGIDGLWWIGRGGGTVDLPLTENLPLELERAVTVYSIFLPLGIYGLYRVWRSRLWVVGLWGTGLMALAVYQLRWEYVFTPALAILAVMGMLGLKQHRIQTSPMMGALTVPIMLAVAMSISSLSAPSIYNQDWRAGLRFLKEQPVGQVLAWADYGSWIIRDADKPVVSSPFARPRPKIVPAQYFASATEEEAQAIASPEYVVVSQRDADPGFWLVVQNVTGSDTSLQESEAWRLWTGRSQDYESIWSSSTVEILKRRWLP